MANKPVSPPKAPKPVEGNPGQPLPANLQGRKSIVIGRGAECDVVIKDPKASRRHCQLTRKESAFVLEDLGSRNGTFVNGERIKGPVTLQPSQAFKAGDTVFYLAP